MKIPLQRWLPAICCVLSLGAQGTDALAAVIPVGPGAFPGGSTLLTFDGFADGTEVNGLSVGGVLFTYTVGGTPLNGALVIDGGPGTTNNISPPNVVSVRNTSGTLTLVLPSSETLFGYGFALLSSATISDASTISLFDGATPVGSQSYAGSPDPNFTGGFAGIESTTPFNTVALTFNFTNVGAFALDNVRFASVSVQVPEPGTLLLVTSGIGFLLCAGLWHRRTKLG